MGFYCANRLQHECIYSAASVADYDIHSLTCICITKFSCHTSPPAKQWPVQQMSYKVYSSELSNFCFLASLLSSPTGINAYADGLCIPVPKQKTSYPSGFLLSSYLAKAT